MPGAAGRRTAAAAPRPRGLAAGPMLAARPGPGLASARHTGGAADDRGQSRAPGPQPARRELALLLLLGAAGLAWCCSPRGRAGRTSRRPRPGRCLPASRPRPARRSCPRPARWRWRPWPAWPPSWPPGGRCAASPAVVLAGLGVGIAVAVSAGISAADVLAAAAAGTGARPAPRPGRASAARPAAAPAGRVGGHRGVRLPLPRGLRGLPWRGVAFAGALAVIAAGVLVTWRAAELPVMSSRYDPPAPASTSGSRRAVLPTAAPTPRRSGSR